MKDKLKKGQAFIGIDDNTYYFLGYDNDNQIMFTNLELWTDKEQKYVVKNNLFIKEILQDKSDIIENSAWYYRTIGELDNSTIEEKIKRCLDIIENSNNDEIQLKPIKIGAFVKGQAYCKRENQFYEVRGFIVENNIYVDKELKDKQIGFFSIYHSNCSDTVPLIFERSFEDNNNFNGKVFLTSDNDKVDIKEELISKKEVNDSVNGNLQERFEKENVSCRFL